jgi:acyl-CoA synthetase (AMP-forming)/AMP-acid ligase II
MIIKSPYDDVELVPVPLHDYVLHGAEGRGSRPAIIDGPTGRVLTYGELASSVRKAAAGLAARGVAQGDVLALCSPNSPEFAVAYYGALAAGALVTTVNPLAPAGDIARQLTHSGARWLITTAALAQGSAGEAAAAAGVRETFAIGAADAAGGSGRATPFSALTDTGRPDRLPAVDPDDNAVLFYSSGTTGLPKGVLLSHRSLVASLCQTRAVHRVGPDDVLVTVLPLYHIFALQITLSLGLAAGATVITMPRFDLETFCGLVQEHGVTRVEVVPPIVLGLARHPAVTGYDLSSLRLITSGAAPLGAALATECARRLGCRVKQAYGMTEFGGATHMVPDSGGGLAESVGPLLPGAQARVIDCATGLDAGPGQPGELLIRTPGAMRGYLGNPEATVDADGWPHTGDVVEADPEGWFTVVDRVKELIKYKGSQVAPAALEAILLAHPAVADVAVIGRFDEDAGEIPTAVVVLRQPAAGGTEPVARELMAYVAGRVAPHEKIRRVEFATEIPRSPSGKILRRQLARRGQPAIPSRPRAVAGQPR